MTRCETLATKLRQFDQATWEKAKREVSDASALDKLKPTHVFDPEWSGGTSVENLRIELIREEFNEVDDAFYDGNDNQHTLKELCDLVYVCVGTATKFGWDFDTAFNKVHENNMKKITDGTFRADGKLLKDANHPQVDLTSCVQK